MASYCSNNFAELVPEESKRIIKIPFRYIFAEEIISLDINTLYLNWNKN